MRNEYFRLKTFNKSHKMNLGTNKKGMMVNQVIIGVILLAALVIFLVFLVKTGVSAVFVAENSQCKTSILAHTALLSSTKEVVVPDIYCPTTYIKVSSKNEDAIKRYVAESMKSCWGTWGKGELQLFRGDGYFCHMCSVMEFKHERLEVTGLTDYLADNVIEKGSGEGLTYLDYLTGYSTNSASTEFKEQVKSNAAADTINTSRKYATMFIYAKGEDSMKELFEGLDALYQKKKSTSGISGLFGAAGGATAGILTVAIIGTGGTAAVVIGAGALIGAGIGIIIDILHDKGAEWTAMIMFNEYDADTLRLIGCERSDVKQDNQAESLG